MNVLFLTLVQFESIKERNIYTDLLREFVKNKHHIYAISPVEKRQNIKTHLIEETNDTILRLRIGNIQKTNIIEKGVSTLLIESQFIRAIKKYFSDIKFDLILYSTPPITLVSAIEFVKRRDGAKTYLLLKDIFPQNAVDIGMLSTKGLKGILYRHFRNQEKKLYKISDTIGCMSPANLQYILDHNPEVRARDDQIRSVSGKGIIEVCPNSIDVVDKSINVETKKQIRNKYGIPLDKKILVYGGNLGKPQDIPFVIECLKRCQDIKGIYFLIIGDGTDFHFLKEYMEDEEPKHVKLMQKLPKEEFEILVGACDVGLIFLDHRFTIPNFPSRLLSYMSAKLSILACTDKNSDIGKIIVDGGFGKWCESNDADNFVMAVKEEIKTPSSGWKAYEYLQTNYSVKQGYNIIQRIML